uniref:Uncharacterized protein n=1 Tax=Fusarium oxysporum (strain Fo5176) TaxID=660025 RepID=A0A0D2YDB8_FUSOF
KEENEEENEEGQVIRRPALWAPGDQWPNHRRMGILAVGIDSSYHYQWYDDADSPHAWRPVGGTWQLEPEVVTLSHDKVPLIAIFGLAIDSTLQWKFWDGGNPTGVLDSLGGRWLGPPTVVTKQGSAGPQSAWDLFIVGWDLKLYHVQGSFIWQATPPGHGRGAGAPGGGAFVPRWGSFEPLGGLTE